MFRRGARFSPSVCALLLLTAFAAQPVRAGMFDDEEARRQIKDLTIQTNERFDTLSKAQFELVNQIQALREENARLRGQVETLNYELDATKKRQQDFYVDLDGRLRKLEPQLAVEQKPVEGAAAAADPAQKPAADPEAETREYESALNLFKAGKFKQAASAFEAFNKARPDSSLAPNAQYWLGNAHYAQRDCKKSMDAHRRLVSKWPQHPRAPDALMNVATCQQDLGDGKGARSTFQTILKNYPDSKAAGTAKQRLK